MTNQLRVKEIVKPTGSMIQRLIGTVDCRGNGTTHSLAEVDPLLLVDHATGIQKDHLFTPFGAHPHQGFSAITYVRRGKLFPHSNQVPAEKSLLRAGAPGGQDHALFFEAQAQATREIHAPAAYTAFAGAGVVHDEIIVPSEAPLDAFQIWVNAKDALRLGDPFEQTANDLPSVPVNLADGSVAGSALVVTGTFASTKGPIQTVANPDGFNLVDFRVNAGAKNIQVPVPAGFNSVAFVTGSMSVAGSDLLASDGDTVVFERSDQDGVVIVSNTSESSELVFLFCAAHPIGEPWVKLLFHNGGIIRRTEEEAVAAMEQFNSDPMNFGVKAA